MSKIKTYGEIQYYLYDGDKKEKKVSRDNFLNSKEVDVTHFTPKPKQQTTTSLTGKVIESFSDFCNEINGANLPIDYNKTYKTNAFDGGDGPSGTPLVEPYKRNVTNYKKPSGNNARKKQELREKDKKKRSKEYRISKNMVYQTNDDLIKPGVPVRQPNVYAGGAM